MSIYNPPQFGQGGGQDAGNLIQLAMAVKSFKMQEKKQKKDEASQRVSMLMSNPQLLLMQDPKEMEKDLATLGIKVTDQLPANPQDAAKTAPPTKQDPTQGEGSIDPNQMATLVGATGGNKSGAQSASPASPNAAGKAPGGGVTGSLMSPQMVESMAAKASERLKQNYGALAPIYMGAQSQLDAARHQAQLQGEIDTLKEGAASGDIRSMARLAGLAGHQVTDSDIRNMVIANGSDEKAVGQAMDVALHNETGDSKALRFQNMSKDLLGNPQVMDKLVNPLDAYKITSSIVYAGALPEGVEMKSHTMAEYKAEADYEHQLAEDYGTPYSINHFVARSRTLGLSPSGVLPPAMMGIFSKGNLPGQKAAAATKQADAAMLSATAEKEKADNEHLKITSALETKKSDDLLDRLKLMGEADKAGHGWPEDLKDSILQQVAAESGLELSRVSHWYNWLYMGKGSLEGKPIPALDVAREAAGGGSSSTKEKGEVNITIKGGREKSRQRYYQREADKIKSGAGGVSADNLITIKDR
jgi:hypothetical protein